jgi:hypothetical protein
MATITITRGASSFFFGLNMAKGYVCFFNNVFINENEIDEQEIKEEGTKHLLTIILF